MAPTGAKCIAPLHRTCVDRLRRSPKLRTVALTDVHAGPPVESDPVLLAERNERRDRVWRAILRLPPQHRQVIVLSHFQQMSYKEIATSIGVPMGTVMSRLYHARRALRQKLADEEP